MDFQAGLTSRHKRKTVVSQLTSEKVTGTGGGTSIRSGDHIFIAPSGVQKELMKPTDMFVMDFHTREYLRKPRELKPSACTPLFLAAFTKRGAGCCIHTHSQWAVLITLLVEKEFGRSAPFEIKEIEQIKGIPASYEEINTRNDEHDSRAVPQAGIDSGANGQIVMAENVDAQKNEYRNGVPIQPYSSAYTTSTVPQPPPRVKSPEEEEEDAMVADEPPKKSMDRGLLEKKEKPPRKVPYLGYYDTLRIPIIENTAQ
jgi:hypothetical protein